MPASGWFIAHRRARLRAIRGAACTWYPRPSVPSSTFTCCLGLLFATARRNPATTPGLALPLRPAARHARSVNPHGITTASDAEGALPRAVGGRLDEDSGRPATGLDARYRCRPALHVPLTRYAMALVTPSLLSDGARPLTAYLCYLNPLLAVCPSPTRT